MNIMYKERKLEPEKNTKLYLDHCIKNANNIGHFSHALFLKSEIRGFRNISSVLDVACGIGDISYVLAIDDKISVHGIDNNRAAISYAKQRRLPNLSYAVRDAYNLEELGNTYDLVYCWGSLHHFADTEKAIEQMVKVAKKKIFIYDFCREIQPEMMYKLEEAEINHGFNFTMADSIKAALTLKELTEIAKHLNVNFRIRMNDEILDQFNITYSTLLCVIDK